MYRLIIRDQVEPKPLKYKPCALVMGLTGAGKTTLANKLCGTEHRAGAAKGSVTQALYRNDVGCGQNAFSLIDTPGTDSTVEPYKHAILLRNALTATNLNTIFLIVKYNNRFDKMVEEYYKVEQPVYKYNRKIVVMISHMDVAQDPHGEFQDIRESFQEECPNIANIIFYSNLCDEGDIADAMYACISNMELEIIKISDEEFHLHFNIYEMKNQMKRSFNEYKKKVQELVQKYSEAIGNSNSVSVDDKDELLHMMIVEFRSDIDELYDEFIGKHGGDMIDLDYYALAIKMQKENVNTCDDFVSKVTQLMSYNLFDNTDPRNLIKQCPHCGLIWYKTEGCDGQTTCGNRGRLWDSATKAIFKYVLSWQNNKLTWEKNPMPKPAIQEPNRSTSKGQGIGCGRTIVWGQLPKLSDEYIFELYKVKTIEEAKNLIQKEKYKEARQEYEKNIDIKFQN